jgi:hypothetical protein
VEDRRHAYLASQHRASHNVLVCNTVKRTLQQQLHATNCDIPAFRCNGELNIVNKQSSYAADHFQRVAVERREAIGRRHAPSVMPQELEDDSVRSLSFPRLRRGARSSKR